MLTFHEEEGGGLDAAQVDGIFARVLHLRFVDDQRVGVALRLELELASREDLLKGTESKMIRTLCPILKGYPSH